MRISLILILLFVASTGLIIKGQDLTNSRQKPATQYQAYALGISFSEVGNITKLDSLTFEINLSATNNLTPESAIAKITKSDRLFIDLPGSYGGRMYLDSPDANRLSKDIIKVDSVGNGKYKFRREYWSVYAGMGMWDCVINSYVKDSGHYYIISMIQEKPLGKPGLLIDVKSLKAEDLKLKALSSLQDKNNSNVEKFNELLSSFQIQN